MIGHKLRNYPITSFFGRLIDKDSLAKVEQFFEKHGVVLLSLARYMLIIQIFAPFVVFNSGFASTFYSLQVIEHGS